jgi:hypothetical protein
MRTEIVVALINGSVTLAGVLATQRLRASPPPTHRAADSPAISATDRVIYLPGGSETRSVPVRSSAAEPVRQPQSWVDNLARAFNPVWTAAQRLRPLRRRVRPWLAVILGFALGGIGIVLYFRTRTDVLAGVVLVAAAMALGIVVYVVTETALPWYAGAALPALYGYLRAQASNRALTLSSASPDAGGLSV